MLVTLALRHLLVKPVRSLLLLLGFALGVGVMIVLLSVGEAMLDQSRDVSLVGGGEVTVLPEGIDIEALRTGGLSGMFFTVDRARYVTRQVLAGPRLRELVAAASPVIEDKLLYLVRGRDTVPVLAGGEIPSRSREVGAGHTVLAGVWEDTPADSAWVSPTPGQLYDQLDHFHPTVDDSTWGEWHYFNLVTGADEWWYLTLLVGGRVGRGAWGGQVLVTHREPGGRYRRYTSSIPASAIQFDTTGADLTLGTNLVRQRDGTYRVVVALPEEALRMEFTLHPAPARYFPPVLLEEGRVVSGYTVPALAGSAEGRICRSGGCRSFNEAAAYHDHNWGVWRDVTWEWGEATGDKLSLLYGIVRTPESRPSGESFFVAIMDSLGIRQILRGREVERLGAQPAANDPGVQAPQTLRFRAARDGDTVTVQVAVREALASRMSATGFRRYFLQMRGRFRLEGRIGEQAVADSGSGFFETWVDAPLTPRRGTRASP